MDDAFLRSGCFRNKSTRKGYPSTGKRERGETSSDIPFSSWIAKTDFLSVLENGLVLTSRLRICISRETSCTSNKQRRLRAWCPAVTFAYKVWRLQLASAAPSCLSLLTRTLLGRATAPTAITGACLTNTLPRRVEYLFVCRKSNEDEYISAC